MTNTMKNQTSLRIGVVIALMAALLVPGLASAQTPTVTVDLCATTGTVALPGGASVPIWGYVLADATACATATASLPGPVIDVAAGTEVTVNLHNNLPEATALNFVGIPMVPDLTGAPGFDGITLGEKSYTFVAADPGTYLYEAGMLPNAQHQIAMGMHGAMVVRPAAGQAYGPASAFDDEAVLVLSEIDPALNESADPAAFDMRDFAPKHGLINGKAAPDTDPIATAAGNTLLLRYLNAGVLHRSMNLLGASQTIIAGDGSPLAHPYSVAAEDIAPGETLDALVRVDPVSPDARWPLYDGAFLLGGGMSTFVEVAGAPVQPPTTLDFTALTIESYGGTAQDVSGGATVSTDGTTITLQGNTWKAIALPTTVGPNTVLEFDFSSTAEGEIHGIGFDTETAGLSPEWIFQLYGTQTYALQNFHTYPGGGAVGDVVHYTIPVGQFYTGAFGYLVLANDHDIASPTAVSVFSNVSIYDTVIPQAPRPPGVVDLSASPFLPYGGQDISGSATVMDTGAKVRFDGNTWKLFPFAYDVTPKTILEFDFSSTAQGEIHAIGFENDTTLSADQIFQLYGTQLPASYGGRPDFYDYPGSGTVHYTIPVGQFYTGSFQYIVFANDHDVASPTAVGVFSNIEIYESGETQGPNTTSLWLVPNPSGGTGDVLLRATGNDKATGNSYVTGAEYFIDTDPGEGAGTAMDLNLFAPIVSETALIDTTVLGEGAHTVSVRSMDEFDNWGPVSTIDLTVDQTGPVVDGVTLDPNPNDGNTPYNPSRRVLRVLVTVTDAVSNVKAAEGLLVDSTGAFGPFGPFPLTPKDGLFDEMVEVAYFDIPLPTIGLLSVGNHTVEVRGLDASGNWGEHTVTTLTITGP